MTSTIRTASRRGFVASLAAIVFPAATVSAATSRGKAQAIRSAATRYRKALAILDDDEAREADYFAARGDLIEAILSLGSSNLPAANHGIDPVHAQTVKVDDVVFSLSYEHSAREWYLTIAEPDEVVEV